MKRTITAVLLISVFTTALVSSGACRENVYYSVLFPGWGQMKDGRYGKGTFLMGTELILLTGVLMSNIQYDRDVEQYEQASAAFRSAEYIGDRMTYHREMIDKWEDADRMDTYRKVLAGAAVGVWALSIVDMIYGEDSNVKPLTLDLKEDGFLVTRSFRF